MLTSRGHRARCISLLMLVSVPLTALAQHQFSVLDEVNSKFELLQHGWYAVVSTYAQRLFWGLAAVDFGWTALVLILDQNEIQAFFSALVRKIVTLGFFFALLKMAGSWIPNIIHSLRRIGMTAGAVSANITPDGVVNEGYELALGAFQALRELGVLDAIAVVLPITMLAVLIFLSFLLIAAQLLVTQIESYLCIGAGIILLGFGGAHWTKDIAATYMRYALAVGLKIMILYLVVGAGQTLFDNLKLDANHLFHSCLIAAGSALVYAYLTTQIPSIVRAMLFDPSGIFGESVPRAVLKAGAAAASVSWAATVGGAKAIQRMYTSTEATGHGPAPAVDVAQPLGRQSELRRTADRQTSVQTGRNFADLGLPHPALGSAARHADRNRVHRRPVAGR